MKLVATILFTLLFSLIGRTEAAPPRGSAIPLSCANPNLAGATIAPSNTNCFLHSSGPHVTTGNFFQYALNSGGCGTSTYCLQFSATQGATGSAVGSYIGFTSQAQNCQSGSDIYAHVDAPLFGSDLWFRMVDAGTGSLNDEFQTAGSCAAPVASFVNNTTTISYFSASDMGFASAASQAMEIKLMPSGVPFYASMGSFPNINGWTSNGSGQTLTIDSGVKLYGTSCDGTAGALCIKHSNVTINGAGATVGYTSHASELIELLHGSTNPTVQGASGNYFTIDCQAAFGQAFAGQSPHGVLSGVSTGTPTLAHLIIQNCGQGGGGQIHAIYLSNGPLGADDLNYCESVNDVLVPDAGGDGPAVKFDDTCGTAQGVVTGLAVYCTIEGHAANNCDQNESLGYQCGGWHLAQKGLLEQYGQPTNFSQWAFSKNNWGALGSGGCSTTAPPTQITHLDKYDIVFDGHADYGEAPIDADDGQRHLVVMCGSARNGTSSCNSNATGYPALCFTNGHIVEDDDNFNATNQLVVGQRVFTDTGCTTNTGTDSNTYYRGLTATVNAGRRLICGNAANWPSDGNNCAWPYVPQRLTDANFETHDQLVARAHGAGLCGEGTSGDPIRVCPQVRMATLRADRG